MIDHYNAFISYKHAPEDNRVAEAVQKGLEHFKIPSAIKKKTGMKRIQRIFRDKDELPITSDLSETIANALEHSDYLIVICSTNTKQSIWVQREIEYFLRNHTRRQILTVLVNGEPEEVIPPILLYEDRVALNEFGQQQTFRMPLEPLSCDYRMAHYKAHRIELPRLASALIGCSYDELMNRRRMYRIKQTVAVFAGISLLFSGFTVYMLDSKNQIHENYIKALENQSKYLANASLDLLEKEQRITALQLALEALPKDEKDERPVTTEAIRALSKASLAYVSEKNTNVKSEWNYTMSSSVRDFEVSPEETRFAAFDISGRVKVWDTTTHREILRLGSKKQPLYGFLLVSDAEVLVWDRNGIYLYDVSNSSLENDQNKEPKWSYELKDKYFKDIKPVLASDGYVYILDIDLEMYKFNVTDGALDKTYDLTNINSNDEYNLVELQISPDGKKIGVIGYGGTSYLAGVVETADGKVSSTVSEEEKIIDIGFADNDHLLVSLSQVNNQSNIEYGTTSIIQNNHDTIKCYDTADFSEVWTADFVFSDVRKNCGFVALPKKNAVAYYCANKSVIYDVKTGKVLYDHNVNEPIVEISDVDEDGVPSFVTENGCLGFAYETNGNDSVALTKFFMDNIVNAIIDNGIYVQKEGSDEVVYYGTNVYDKNWKELKEGITLQNFYGDCYMDENVLAIMQDIKESEDKKKLLIFDLNESGKMIEAEVDLESGYLYEILGAWEGKIYIAFSGNESVELISVDIKSGEVERKTVYDKYVSISCNCSMRDGKFIFTYHTGTDMLDVMYYDIKTEESEIFKVPEDSGFPHVSPEKYGEHIYYSSSEDYIIDVANGKNMKVELPEGWNGTKKLATNSKEDLFAISDDSSIVLVDVNGKEICQVDHPEVKSLGMYFYSKYGEGENEVLLVFYDDGSLGRYSPIDGSQVGMSETSTYYGLNTSAKFAESNDKSQLYIFYEDRMNIIDTASWMEITTVDSCLGYHKASDRFITYASPDADESKIGYFNRYSNDELIAKARGIVGDSELSSELKNEYGIEE